MHLIQQCGRHKAALIVLFLLGLLKTNFLKRELRFTFQISKFCSEFQSFSNQQPRLRIKKSPFNENTSIEVKLITGAIYKKT